MADKTECPKCKEKFAVKGYLKYRLLATPSFVKLVLDNMVTPWKSGFEEVYKAHLVVCPICGNEFTTSGYKYFGFLKVNHLQIGLVVFFLFFIFAPVAVIFWNIWR